MRCFLDGVACAFLMLLVTFTIVQVYSAINSIIRAADALERIAAALEDEEDEENEEEA